MAWSHTSKVSFLKARMKADHCGPVVVRRPAARSLVSRTAAPPSARPTSTHASFGLDLVDFRQLVGVDFMLASFQLTRGIVHEISGILCAHGRFREHSVFVSVCLYICFVVEESWSSGELHQLRGVVVETLTAWYSNQLCFGARGLDTCVLTL